jgi:hypothetical protein
VDRRLGGLQDQSGRGGEVKNPYTYRDSNPGRPVRILVAILNELLLVICLLRVISIGLRHGVNSSDEGQRIIKQVVSMQWICFRTKWGQIPVHVLLQNRNLEDNLLFIRLLLWVLLSLYVSLSFIVAIQHLHHSDCLIMTFILSWRMHIQNNNITPTGSQRYILHPTSNKLHLLNTWYDYLMYEKSSTEMCIHIRGPV